MIDTRLPLLQPSLRLPPKILSTKTENMVVAQQALHEAVAHPNMSLHRYLASLLLA